MIIILKPNSEETKVQELVKTLETGYGLEVQRIVHALKKIRHRLDQFDAKQVFGADTLDSAKLFGGGLQNALQGFEAFQGGLRLALAVLPGRRQREQHFDHLVVVKSRQTRG